MEVGELCFLHLLSRADTVGTHISPHRQATKVLGSFLDSPCQVHSWYLGHLEACPAPAVRKGSPKTSFCLGLDNATLKAFLWYKTESKALEQSRWNCLGTLQKEGPMTARERSLGSLTCHMQTQPTFKANHVLA